MTKGLLITGTSLFATCALFLPKVEAASLIVTPAGSTVIASWSFEGYTLANTTGTTLNLGAADIGEQIAGSAAGIVHTNSSTYTLLAGNGSAKSPGSNTWSVGDYYQFTLNTSSFSNINVAFSDRGSNTGPKNFKLSYSLDGGAFADAATFVAANNGFSTSTVNQSAVYQFDLAALLPGVNFAAATTTTFRLVDTSTVAITNGTVATTGTNQLDDFTVSSGPISFATVPEPSSALALFGGLGMLVGVRRSRTRLA